MILLNPVGRIPDFGSMLRQLQNFVSMKSERSIAFALSERVWRTDACREYCNTVMVSSVILYRNRFAFPKSPGFFIPLYASLKSGTRQFDCENASQFDRHNQ
jgi:hypothetical protein